MLLLSGIVSVFLALIFYAASLFRELARKELSLRTLVFFWLGFGFDLAGTVLMSLVSEGFAFNFHSILGISALLLMGIKAIWSSANYREGLGKKVPSAYTIFSALVWLAVFILGFFLA